MDVFPLDISQRSASNKFGAIHEALLQTGRQEIYVAYQEALRNESLGFEFNFTKYCPFVRICLVRELLMRFQRIYQKSTPYRMLMAPVVTNTLNKMEWISISVPLLIVPDRLAEHNLEHIFVPLSCDSFNAQEYYWAN